MTYTTIGLWENEEAVVIEALKEFAHETLDHNKEGLAKGVITKLEGTNENQNNEQG